MINNIFKQYKNKLLFRKHALVLLIHYLYSTKIIVYKTCAIWIVQKRKIFLKARKSSAPKSVARANHTWMHLQDRKNSYKLATSKYYFEIPNFGMGGLWAYDLRTWLTFRKLKSIKQTTDLFHNTAVMIFFSSVWKHFTLLLNSWLGI